MGPIAKLKLLWTARKAQGVIVEQVKAGWDWRKSLAKAAKSFGAHFLTLVLTVALTVDEAKLKRFLDEAEVPAPVAVVLVPLGMAAIRYGGNWRKHAGLVLLALALTATPAHAQEAPPADAVVIEVDIAAQAVVTRSARDDRAAARATLDTPLPADHFRAALRLEASGVQSGGDLPFDPYNPRTFRAFQALAEVRRQADNGFAVGFLAGATWSIEGVDGPRDPRLWTAAVLARVPLPGKGWARAGGGHHGPVGGWAALGGLQYPAGPARVLVDYALPIIRAEDGAPLSWQLTLMTSIPVKRWVIR